MATNQDMTDKRSGLYSKATSLLPLFVVYIFLPGAVYLNFYYRSFGVSTRWLDIPASEVLLRAFTLMLDFKTLFAVVFGLLLLGPVLVEITTNLSTSVVVNTVLVLTYIMSPLYLYVESRAVASEDARRDKGKGTTLPFITYSLKNCAIGTGSNQSLLSKKGPPGQPAPQVSTNNCIRHGRLLMIRNQTLFVMSDAPAEAEDVREIHLLPSDTVDNVTLVRSSQ